MTIAIETGGTATATLTYTDSYNQPYGIMALPTAGVSYKFTVTYDWKNAPSTVYPAPDYTVKFYST